MSQDKPWISFVGNGCTSLGGARTCLCMVVMSVVAVIPSIEIKYLLSMLRRRRRMGVETKKKFRHGNYWQLRLRVGCENKRRLLSTIVYCSRCYIIRMVGSSWRRRHFRGPFAFFKKSISLLLLLWPLPRSKWIHNKRETRILCSSVHHWVHYLSSLKFAWWMEFFKLATCTRRLHWND